MQHVHRVEVIFWEPSDVGLTVRLDDDRSLFGHRGLAMQHVEVLLLVAVNTANFPRSHHAASVVGGPETNVCREYTAVKINPCTTRRRPSPVSVSRPSRPKSTCSSAPGSKSATGTVACRRPKSNSSVA